MIVKKGEDSHIKHLFVASGVCDFIVVDTLKSNPCKHTSQSLETTDESVRLNMWEMRVESINHNVPGNLSSHSHGRLPGTVPQAYMNYNCRN